MGLTLWRPSSGRLTQARLPRRRAAGKFTRLHSPPRPWSWVAEDETAGPASAGSCRRWGASRRTSAAASSSSPRRLTSPCAPSAPSPTPTRGSLRCRAAPARGRGPTRAGSAGAGRRSSGLRSTTRCSSTRASALLVMELGCSAA